MAYIGNKPSETFHTTTKQEFTPDGSTIIYFEHSVVGENSGNFINNVKQNNWKHTAFTTLTCQGKTECDSILQGGKVIILLTTIQGSHIHNFDLTGKTVTLPNAAVTSTHVTQHLSYSSGVATGDGSTTAFTINANRAVADVLVHVNGLLMTPTADYTISGTTLTFQTAPASSAEIDFRYLPK